MYGVYQFLKKAEAVAKNGGQAIKPIVGCEFYTSKDINVKTVSADGDENQNHLVLLAKNTEGYFNLVKLNSIAFVDGFYYKPKIDLSVLEKHTGGLICLSACLAGAIPQKLLRGDYDGALEYAKKLKSMFAPGDFYIELQDHGIPDEKRINPLLLKIAREIGVKPVATNDVHYLERADAEMHDILLCVQTGKTLADENRLRFQGKEFYMKDADEMAELFAWCGEAVENTLEIADKCEAIKLEKSDLMPFYVPDNGQTPQEFLRGLTYARLKDRYPKPTEEIYKRVEYELDTVIRMGFAEYYLIVWDFIDYSKRNGIPVGPGRGSGVGSIVAYIIGITNVDPLKYDLLFERFLNAERVSSPDFDIDFCYEGRGKVIEYVIGKYGKDKVSQIVTFGTMAAKAAIKDVGRVYGIPYADVERITKLMPLAVKATICEMIGLSADGSESSDDGDGGSAQRSKLIPELAALYREDETAARIIDMAMKIEGMPRNTSMHAAGVVICRAPVGEKVPLAKNGADITTQYNMTELEELGLLKMDFLGLRTLTDIKKALEYIREDTGAVIDFDKMAFDDKNVFELIASGETDAVFQLESAGMRRFMAQLAPSSMDDIMAGIALYRPGPMDYIPTYIKSKQNPDAIDYKYPKLKEILSTTYGCIVYQEQVMRIVRELAGYSLGGADNVRRVMSKKKLDAMAKEEDKFINGFFDEKKNVMVPGALKTGVPPDVAKELFDNMAKFANYAFNKSHAAAYAYLSYETAYLKRYYPAHFLTAVINNRITNIDEVAKYIGILKTNKIKVFPPDINKSGVYFTVENDGVRFGLMGIKNIGEAAVSAIVRERTENGDFTDLVDFLERGDRDYINKRMLESLIKGGAFDGFGRTRSQLMSVYEYAADAVSGDKKNKGSGQMSLFDAEIDELRINVAYPNLAEYTENLKLSYEKEVLGMYISGHPLNDFIDEFKKLSFNMSMIGGEADETDPDGPDASAHYNVRDGMFVTAAGVLGGLSRKITKNGKTMAYGRIEDLFGTVETVFFPSQYEKYRAVLRDGIIIKVGGTIRLSREESPKIIVNELIVWDKTAKDGGETRDGGVQAVRKRKILYIKIDENPEKILDNLSEIFRSYPGETAVKVQHGGRVYETDCYVDFSPAMRWELNTVITDTADLKYVEK
jgi:DNA polymerase-3 subunit alpha